MEQEPAETVRAAGGICDHRHRRAFPRRRGAAGARAHTIHRSDTQAHAGRPSLDRARLHGRRGGRGRRRARLHRPEGDGGRYADERGVCPLRRADGAGGGEDRAARLEARARSASCLGDPPVRARDRFVALPDGLRLLGAGGERGRPYEDVRRPVRRRDVVLLLHPESAGRRGRHPRPSRSCLGRDAVDRRRAPHRRDRVHRAGNVLFHAATTGDREFWRGCSAAPYRAQ